MKITGCTVHYVTAEVDGGPIIDQTPVRIEPTDTLETLDITFMAKVCEGVVRAVLAL